MSVISLFYGQCGNQISETFYSNIYNDIGNNSKRDYDYHTQSLNKWFNVTKTNKWEPRSILIDTENKTVVQKKNTPCQFKNIIAKSCGGSANNWAFGYVEQSKLLANDILECIQKELEKSDRLSSFLNVFGSAGGTGAGVGSFIIECLKNEFPNKSIVNAVILPYLNGEVVIQSYNSLLTLAKLYPISDAMIVFENDRLHYNCINSLSIKDVTFDDINNLVSKQLLSVYQPLKDVQSLELLMKLCEDPLFRFVQIRSAPLSKMDSAFNWKSLLTAISRQSRFDFQQRTLHNVHLKPNSISAALVCRGTHNPTEKDLKPFKDTTPSKSVHIYYQKKKIFNLENTLTVVSNGNNVCVPINLILKDAWNLYRYSAYLHHYKKFGVNEVHFKNSFEIIENILGNYKKL